MTESWGIHWKDYYKILQVHPSAEQEVIKAAYDRLARKYHPDVNKNPAANERMKDINEAFEILGDLEKRKRYHSVWLQKKGVSGAGAGSSAPSRPKPTVDPQNIRFYDVKPGEVKRASFIIRNTGGPYVKISLSKPGPWVRIVRQTSLTTSDKLPLEVEIEAQGEDWGKSYVDHIIVKLDDVETHVRIELQTQPELAREEVAVSGPSKGAATPAPQVSRRGFLGWVKWIMGLAILGIILAIVISLMYSPPSPAPAPAPTAVPTPTPDLDAFVGYWENIDPNTSGITRIEIQEADPTHLAIHPWGKCHPTDCDWGDRTFETQEAPFTITWDAGFAEIRMIFSLQSNGRLEVESFTHFKDGSGRADYRSVYVFGQS